ncbi:hypothetical protein [Candidatus Kuenenia stuttgartiensis]|nr:hypothetical protein [Candidatus Kuenenia stuttgartiensis]
MDAKVGIFRNAPDLRAAVCEIKALQERYRQIKLDYTGSR